MFRIAEIQKNILTLFGIILLAGVLIYLLAPSGIADYTVVGTSYWHETKDRLLLKTAYNYNNIEEIKNFPTTLGDWRGYDFRYSASVYEMLNASILLSRSYSAHGDLIWMDIINSKRGESFHDPKICYERLEEIENPEIATKRMREIYKQKGYSDEWIEKRARGIAVRDELTEEWKKRGVKEQLEYAILTAEISKATFGMTPSEYKNFKALDKPKDNLRDHMTDLELIFTMLGEASTTEIAKKKDAKGFPENKRAATKGGTVAGNARKELEEKSGTKVSTKTNYNELPEAQLRKKKIQ